MEFSFNQSIYGHYLNVELTNPEKVEDIYGYPLQNTEILTTEMKIYTVLSKAEENAV